MNRRRKPLTLEEHAEREERRKVLGGIVALVLMSPFIALLLLLAWEVVTSG